MASIIKKVSDNKDKCNTYARCMERYKEAINHEFYLEAIMSIPCLTRTTTLCTTVCWSM